MYAARGSCATWSLEKIHLYRLHPLPPPTSTIRHHPLPPPTSTTRLTVSSSNFRIPVDNIPSTIPPSLCLYQWRWSTVTQSLLETPLYAATHSPAQQLVALYGIPKARIHTFTSYKKFKEDLQRCEDAFFSGAGKQYLAFGNVQQSSMRPIERGRSRSEPPAFRLLYDVAEEVLIIKLMPGPHHELAASGFVMMFNYKLVSLGIEMCSLMNLGATRFGAPGGR